MPSGVMAPVGVKDDVGGERRGSTSSEGSATSSSTNTRSLCMETAEYLQAAKSRASTAAPPKPAANPLQFVKVGPCHLYRSAQEQLKKAEEVKKITAKDLRREEQEDWQSNLDNWKSSRRKQVEHIIERCVEVKRLESEDSDRNRRRSKTFSEMLEDRAGRRSGRITLPVYSEEDNNDLSDLGIGTSSASGKSSLSEDCDNNSLASDGMDLDKNHSDLDNMSSCETGRKLESSANEYDTCTTATISSPEPEEYTYEGAIQNYKSRIISRTQSSDLLISKLNGINDSYKEKSPESNGISVPRKNSIGSKIENKLSTFEQKRESSVEITSADLNKKSVPKVDILKKRELFEKETSPEQNGVLIKPKPEMANSKSIKERLNHLEKLAEETIIKTAPAISNKSNSLKERLSSLEKCIVEPTEKINVKLSNGDLTSVSLKDRLSSLNNRITPEKIVVTPVVTQSLKDRLANLDSVCNKEIIKDTEPKDKYEELNKVTQNDNNLYDSKRFHRSLDSLDLDDNLPNGKFERVQSMDELCGDSGTGADTDREDSGIHTGDVSCAVSQDEEPVESFTMNISVSKSTQDGVMEFTVQESSSIHIDDGKEDYFQSVSQSSVTEEDPITQEDIFFDKEEDDTVKSMDADNSVSLNDNSISSECENIIFEGKMLIHVNFKEIQSVVNGNKDVDLSTNCTNKNKTVLSCDKVMVSEISTNKPISSSISTSVKTKPSLLNTNIDTNITVRIDNFNSKQRDLSTPSPDRFIQSPPILESSGRWNILQINNKVSPKNSPVSSPNFNMPDVIPIHVNNDKSEVSHEENFVFQVTSNFVSDGKSQSLSPSIKCNTTTQIDNIYFQ